MGAMYQSDPSVTQRPGASCAEHTDRPAATICARCGNYACDLCLRVGQDRQDYCFRCVPMLQQLAEPGTRFVAVLVDRLAVFLPFLVTAFLGGMLSDAMGGDGTAMIGGLSLLGMLGSLGMLGYQLYLIATTGQSIGKRMMGILVVRTDGKPIDVARLVLLRNLVPEFINIATCGLFGIVDPLLIFTAERRCLHDHIADTKVIKVAR